MIYGGILAVLFVAELLCFQIADHFNIIDKPNQRSSHTRIVLRGGGLFLPLPCGFGLLSMVFNILGCSLV